MPAAVRSAEKGKNAEEMNFAAGSFAGRNVKSITAVINF